MSRVVLTDIEGTTSAIDFVHRVLFPYARQRLPDFVRQNQHVPEVAGQVEAARAESAQPKADLEAVIRVLIEWIDADRKATSLKALQGMIWQAGYEQGDFTAHLYVDAYDQLRAWHAAGVALYVYSSGSIAAQKLFFRFSVFGDLSPWFRGHFDTTSGGKREMESYRRIASAIGRPAADILFLSDIEAELDAAREAGMDTVQLLRTDTLPASQGRHRTAADFRSIALN